MKNSVQSFSNETLLPLPCPVCGSQLHPLEGHVKAAGCFDDCLRRCETCGIGFSNSRSDQTRICRNRLDNIPVQVKCGVEETLLEALNERNRANKKVKFGFSTSEDALTWTVFTFLRTSRQLGKVLRSIEIAGGSEGEGEPELLVWGVPQPPTSSPGGLIRKRIIGICDRLGEEPNRRSEPDVIVDFGQFGLVLIEVKYRSGNDLQDFGKKHEKYLDGTDAFAEPQLIRDSRMYELARNWRIGVELANGAPFTLVNLVVKSRESKQIALFDSGLNHRKGQFRVLTWAQLVNHIEAPDWLEGYLKGTF
jgi:hypothetical protein